MVEKEYETITFGGYGWRVLDVQNGRALLIAKDIVEKRAYHIKNEMTTWENCTLRAYLNGTFYDRFSYYEQQRILDTEVFNGNNPKYGTDGGNATTDKIFLLDVNEANKYFFNGPERIAYDKGSSRWWWLRSPGIRNHAAFVYRDGSVNVHGYRVDYAYSGVRPALYLKIS
ncbi:MAG TPA: DUF6273 domain-containing protein [Feifaniaceae bacterium]|nr:DUF6273 domain-containing protein [Feifaniaceae bacterium]